MPPGCPRSHFPKMPSPLGRPSREEALQVALMLKSGMPSLDALAYFYPDLVTSPELLKAEHDRWMRAEQVGKAIIKLQGGPWQEMPLDEQIRFALDKVYAEKAYFLYSHNYALLVGADRQKADTCRQVLEAKIAGTAGKMDAFAAWVDDIRQGKVKLGLPAPVGSNLPLQ